MEDCRDWTEMCVDQIKSTLFQQRDDNSGSAIFWNVTTEKRTINHPRDRGRQYIKTGLQLPCRKRIQLTSGIGGFSNNLTTGGPPELFEAS